MAPSSSMVDFIDGACGRICVRKGRPVISVCIPVGPYPWYKKYLPECLESVRAQTVQPAAVVLVDDMAGLTEKDLEGLGVTVNISEYGEDNPQEFAVAEDTRVLVWRAPWRLGIPAVANVAYALAPTDLAFQLSCDDRLMPNCIEKLTEAWAKHKDPLGFYWVDIEYSTGEKQSLPCGHAMIHKALWKHTGGYPPESGVGACDHIFMNWALQHPDDIHLIHVDGGVLYWHREHEEQYTKHQMVYPTAIAEVREGFNKRWEPIEGKWGRCEP